jgi:uncharacterized membrane protein
MLKNIRQFLLTTLIGGLLVLLPIGLFYLFAKFILDLAATVIKPIADLIKIEGLNNTYILQGIAFLIIIAACFFVGLFVRTRSGKQIYLYFEQRSLAKLPFYNVIKETVQQLLSNRDKSFSQVVIADVMQTKMTGFVTHKHDNGLYTVFVPTAPNPTNGYIFHLKNDQLEFLDIKAEDAMRTIIGVGTGSEILFKKQQTEEE